MEAIYQIAVNVVLSLFAFHLSFRIIPRTTQYFLKAGLYGIDLCKRSDEKM